MPGHQSLWICSAPPDPSWLYTTTRGSCQRRWHFICRRTEGQTGPNTNTETPNSVGTVSAPRFLPSSHPLGEAGDPCGVFPSYQPLLRLERPVDAVHFVVEPASVAQVVPGAILPPERRGHGPAVHALPAVPGEFLQVLWKRYPRGAGQEPSPPDRVTQGRAAHGDPVGEGP